MKQLVVLCLISAAALSAAPTVISQPQSPDPELFGFGHGDWQPPRAGVPAVTLSRVPVFGEVRLGRFWELPVFIDSLPLASFDVDFDDLSGTMWLALSPANDSTLRHYTSTDHGRTWTNVHNVRLDPPAILAPIHIVIGAGDSNYIHTFVRHPAANGDLYDIRLKQDLSYIDVQAVLVGGDTLTRFDVCRDNRPDYGLYVFTSNPYASVWNALFLRSFDLGRTWDRQNGLDLRQPALCAGGGTYIHMACVHARDRGLAYQYNYNRGDPSSWGPGSELGTDTCLIADPKVAVATTTPESLATAWVLYNHSNRNTADWDVDYAVRSDSWGGTWRKHQQLAASPAAERVADAKNDRESDNIYTDAVYVVSDTAAQDSAVVYYTWANSDAPRNWFAPVGVSDTIKVSPVLLPTIVFSPGAAPYPVPGVIFTNYGRNETYFNAAWFEAGAAEQPVADCAQPINLKGNPARGIVQFAPGVPVAEITSIRIFDALGRLVQDFPPAASIFWNCRDRSGRLARPGAYFIRVGTARGLQQTRLTLVP